MIASVEQLESMLNEIKEKTNKAFYVAKCVFNNCGEGIDEYAKTQDLVKGIKYLEQGKIDIALFIANNDGDEEYRRVFAVWLLGHDLDVPNWYYRIEDAWLRPYDQAEWEQ